ncbi:nucleic-acid-binding protein from transposon X-element [Trichonephila clavipes]|nr:nucleic-acid-binding protein from transposon X-element [Trichonephila clavipes]
MEGYLITQFPMTPSSSSPPPYPSSSSATSVEDARLEGSEEEMELSQPTLQNLVMVPEVIKKPRIPSFFVSPKGDWRQLVALAKLIAPSFQSQMSGRFLKVAVGDEVEHRNLSRWLEQSGVEFKSFMLKQDRPVKVVIRGLPSNTEPEDIKTEIEAVGFKVAKISQMKNYRTKAPMPLFYFQIENGADAPKIFDFSQLFGTRIEVKPFDRGNKINQCWRCQGWFHSSEVCHLPPRCVRCAGPHLVKDCTLSFDEPMNKDASINAGLLKDLLVIIEDTPCIDKQVFCRAFKNSLSLRSARHLRTWIKHILFSKPIVGFDTPRPNFPRSR